MKIWFEGSTDVECSLERVKDSLANLGEHYVEVVRRMPGLSQVNLVNQTPDTVTIETNEGLMTRTNFVTHMGTDRVTIEFDEKYDAGKKITATSHFLEEFTSTPTGVQLRAVVSNVEAPGFLGFFYRNLASGSIGKALLKSHKEHLESEATSA